MKARGPPRVGPECQEHTLRAMGGCVTATGLALGAHSGGRQTSKELPVSGDLMVGGRGACNSPSPCPEDLPAVGRIGHCRGGSSSRHWPCSHRGWGSLGCHPEWGWAPGSPWKAPGILQGQQGRVPLCSELEHWGAFGVLSSSLLLLQERQRKYLSLSPWDKATLSMVSPPPPAPMPSPCQAWASDSGHLVTCPPAQSGKPQGPRCPSQAPSRVAMRELPWWRSG